MIVRAPGELLPCIKLGVVESWNFVSPLGFRMRYCHLLVGKSNVASTENVFSLVNASFILGSIS